MVHDDMSTRAKPSQVRKSTQREERRRPVVDGFLRRVRLVLVCVVGSVGRWGTPPANCLKLNSSGSALRSFIAEVFDSVSWQSLSSGGQNFLRQPPGLIRSHSSVVSQVSQRTGTSKSRLGVRKAWQGSQWCE